MKGNIGVYELREILRESHGWSAVQATLAARFYLEVDPPHVLETETNPAMTRPLLTTEQVYEIHRWR